MPITPFPTGTCDPPLSAMVSAETVLAATHTDARTVEEVVLRLAGPVWSRLGYSGGRLWLPDADTGRLLRVARWQSEVGSGQTIADDRTLLLEKGEGLAGWALERSRVEWMGRYAVSNGAPRPECRVCVPLQAAGTVIGVLELVCADAGEPTADRLALLEQLGRRLGGFLYRMGA